MIYGVVIQIRQTTGVNIGKSEESPREICRIIVCSEHTAKMLVE